MNRSPPLAGEATAKYLGKRAISIYAESMNIGNYDCFVNANIIK